MPLDDHAWIFMPPTAILSVLTFTAYFAYRVYCLVIAQQTIQPANALGLAWFFLAVEILTFGELFAIRRSYPTIHTVPTNI